MHNRVATAAAVAALLVMLPASMRTAEARDLTAIYPSQTNCRTDKPPAGTVSGLLACR